MRKISIMILISMMTLGLALTNAYAAGKMTSEKGAATNRATNIIGATVKNLQGENLGKITDLTFDTRDNRISFAILASGGMLGIGEKLIPVPINALSFKDEKNLVLDISKDKLASAPNFEKNKWPDMSNRQWTEDTYRFYGVQPYWKEGVMERDMMEREKGMEKEKPMY
ncbi:MAG: PRC-barrel domain containing protein [Nitrospiraceae bacterium]|nr:MAG: PRC-barrel domain containing protein [Nitrospiraceae bacterium]